MGSCVPVRPLEPLRAFRPSFQVIAMLLRGAASGNAVGGRSRSQLALWRAQPFTCARRQLTPTLLLFSGF